MMDMQPKQHMVSNRGTPEDDGCVGGRYRGSKIEYSTCMYEVADTQHGTQ